MEPIVIASLCLKIQTHSMFIFRVGWNHQPDLVGEYIEKKVQWYGIPNSRND